MNTDFTPADLHAFNSFGLPSTALNCMRIAQPEDLTALAQALAARPNSPYVVLGGGSNVILAPKLKTLIIHNHLKGLDITGQDDQYTYVRAGAGENWHGFVEHCLQNGLKGLENLALIPGTVGASPVQNIGAYGMELQSVCHAVEVFDPQRGEIRSLSAKACEFAYRHSLFKTPKAKHLIITAVHFALPKLWRPKWSYPDLREHFKDAQTPPDAKDIFEAVCQIRRRKLPDPAVQGNAGSFFKNPIISSEKFQWLHAKYPDMPYFAQENGGVKLAAAWLIDQCGWKGRSCGRVAVHSRQALVLVNSGGAVYEEVTLMAEKIGRSVAERFGVVLEPEPVFVS